LAKNNHFPFEMIFLCIKKTQFMIDTIFYLASCDTCRKIIKTLPKGLNLAYHDIKQDPITVEQLEEMYQMAGSYEALFSKKAQLYKSMRLKDKNLGEDDYKKYILEHYTFLSRPVFVIANKIYIGNTQQNMLQVMKAIG
jgi:arsenate reductase